MFTPSKTLLTEKVTSLFQNTISPNLLNILNAEFIGTKIQDTISQMLPTKSLSPNDTSTLFYHKFWSIIGVDITSLALQILNKGKDLTYINKTFIVLIPKVKKPIHANEFRLISLCNVIFKIVTKTIVNRLKRFFLPWVLRNKVHFSIIVLSQIMPFFLLKFSMLWRAGRDGR